MSVAETQFYESLGRPINGPEALTGDWRRFWHLTFNLARTEWKLRFFGSVLGYFWQLMRPLLLFSVLYVFFTVIGHVGSGADAKLGQPNHFYGMQMLGSIVLFTFFAEATGGAVSSVLDREALVRKIQFPRMVIPLSIVLGAMFNLGLNLIVVLVFALASGVRPMLSWFQLPLIVGLLAVFATGLAMLLSSLYVYFRDVAPIWEVISQILFYCSPVIVPLTLVQEKLSPTLVKLYMLNPLADDLPAVPARDDQQRRAGSCRDPRARRRAGRGRDRLRGVRAGLRRVQSHRAVGRREPLTADAA